jgi:hypothetical protein
MPSAAVSLVRALGGAGPSACLQLVSYVYKLSLSQEYTLIYAGKLTFIRTVTQDKIQRQTELLTAFSRFISFL